MEFKVVFLFIKSDLSAGNDYKGLLDQTSEFKCNQTLFITTLCTYDNATMVIFAERSGEV